MATCHVTCREAGIGCLAPPGTTKQIDLNRAEIIKLLITCFSESLYLDPAGELGVKDIMLVSIGLNLKGLTLSLQS